MARTPEESSSDSFHHEIKLMMYSLGDARHPNPDSASLVEEITRQQMENILVQAIKVVHLRGSHTVSMEDFLFLLRKDKGKLRRLMRHLQLKDMIRGAISTKSTSTHEDEQETGVDDGFLPQAKKRKISIEFLNLLDTSFNDQIEPDKDEEERLEKQDALTSSMDSDEYVAYTKCRCVSFHRKAGKFKEWLKIGSYSELQPTQEVMEVLNYLAYDTVREIVELSIQVKRDMESYYLDPSSAHNPHLPLPRSKTTDQLERQSVSSSDSRNGDVNSNPAVVDSTCLPTTPNSAAPDSQHSGTSTTTRSTQDGRKRHRTASSASQETTPTVSNTAKNVTTDINRHSRAIQVVHIREAMRRHSFLAGPLTPLATHILNPTIKQRTLCL